MINCFDKILTDVPNKDIPQLFFWEKIFVFRWVKEDEQWIRDRKKEEKEISDIKKRNEQILEIRRKNFGKNLGIH